MLIQKYQSSWQHDFNEIKEVIISSLNNLEIRIEHVGSTSIENLAAKPIIDIDIAYDNKVSFNEIKSGLEKLNYYHVGNMGIEDREVFKREAQEKKHLILDNIIHHLYVCPVDGREFIRHITFRNYLRKHEKERKDYEKLKIKIAEQANQDRKEYAKIKEIAAREFVELILKKAQRES